MTERRKDFLWHLEQSYVWTDKHGNVHRVDEMPREYCFNLYAFLMRRSARLQLARTMRLIAQLSHWDMLSEKPYGTVPSNAYDAVWDEYIDASWLDSKKWLEEKPLMRRLMERIKEEPPTQELDVPAT